MSLRMTPARMTATTPSSGHSSWRPPTIRFQGEVTGAHLLDIAPTLLDLAGYEIPAATSGAGHWLRVSVSKLPTREITLLTTRSLSVID